MGWADVNVMMYAKFVELIVPMLDIRYIPFSSLVILLKKCITPASLYRCCYCYCLRFQVFGTTRPLPPLGQLGRPGTASEIDELQRARFGTFWQAILTVFQVMTVEDWELVMYGFIRAQGYGSTLYFLIWVIISKYTFLTLFLAVTLEVFEQKYKTEMIKKQKVGTGKKKCGA